MRLRSFEEGRARLLELAGREIRPGRLSEDPRLLGPVADVLERAERLAVEDERRRGVSVRRCEGGKAAERQPRSLPVAQTLLQREGLLVPGVRRVGVAESAVQHA